MGDVGSIFGSWKERKGKGREEGRDVSLLVLFIGESLGCCDGFGLDYFVFRGLEGWKRDWEMKGFMWRKKRDSSVLGLLE